MKVLELLCEPISSGGQESFVMNVFNSIDTSIFQIDLYTPYYCDNKLIIAQVNDRGGTVTESGLKFKAGGFKFNIITPIRETIRKNRYDVVHIHSGSVMSLACASYAAKSEHVKKIIVHSHCTAERHTLKRDTVKLLSTPIISISATDYCACSEEAGKWKFTRNVCRNKLNVINNGIDLDRFAFNPYVRNRIRDNLHIKNSEFVIGHVGRFCYQKNQEYIIEILHRLVDKGIDAKAVFIGSGETYDTIKRQADEYDLKNKTIFVGNVNNVNDYMQAFDVFLFPSRFEGLGIVAIEAQASGLPVVVSEKVPNDVLITNKVVRLPLSDINGWIDHIVEVKNSMTNVLRCSETDSLRNAGYDIVDTIRRIESIYGK